MERSQNSAPRLLIIGAGFAGLKAAAEAAKHNLADHGGGPQESPHLSTFALPGCDGWIVAGRNCRTNSRCSAEILEY